MEIYKLLVICIIIHPSSDSLSFVVLLNFLRKLKGILSHLVVLDKRIDTPNHLLKLELFKQANTLVAWRYYLELLLRLLLDDPDNSGSVLNFLLLFLIVVIFVLVYHVLKNILKYFADSGSLDFACWGVEFELFVNMNNGWFIDQF